MYKNSLQRQFVHLSKHKNHHLSKLNTDFKNLITHTMRVAVFIIAAFIIVGGIRIHPANAAPVQDDDAIYTIDTTTSPSLPSSSNVILLQDSPTDGSASDETEGEEEEAYKTAHMVLAVVSWGVMIPLGIFSARYFKPHTKYWFKIHRIVNTTAFLLAIVAVAFGFVANGGWESDRPVHRSLGITCTALGLMQMTALIKALHPAVNHKMRGVWFLIHSWVGRSASILAIANIYYGIIHVGELGTWAWSTYTLFLVCVIIAGAVMEVNNRQLRVHENNEKNINGHALKPNGAISSTNGNDAVAMLN